MLGKRSEQKECQGDGQGSPVEDILACKEICGIPYCLVKFAGIGNEYNTWLSCEEIAKIKNGWQLLKNWHLKLGEKACQEHRTNIEENATVGKFKFITSKTHQNNVDFAAFQFEKPKGKKLSAKLEIFDFHDYPILSRQNTWSFDQEVVELKQTAKTMPQRMEKSKSNKENLKLDTIQQKEPKKSTRTSAEKAFPKEVSVEEEKIASLALKNELEVFAIPNSNAKMQSMKAGTEKARESYEELKSAETDCLPLNSPQKPLETKNYNISYVSMKYYPPINVLKVNRGPQKPAPVEPASKGINFAALSEERLKDLMGGATNNNIFNKFEDRSGIANFNQTEYIKNSLRHGYQKRRLVEVPVQKNATGIDSEKRLILEDDNTHQPPCPSRNSPCRSDPIREACDIKAEMNAQEASPPKPVQEVDDPRQVTSTAIGLVDDSQPKSTQAEPAAEGKAKSPHKAEAAVCDGLA